MISITKKIAHVLSMFVFLILVLVGILTKEHFSLTDLPGIGLKAFTGYVIFWLFGLVISDLILKSIQNAVEDKKMEDWEGGMLSFFSSDKNDELSKTHLNKKRA